MKENNAKNKIFTSCLVNDEILEPTLCPLRNFESAGRMKTLLLLLLLLFAVLLTRGGGAIVDDGEIVAADVDDALSCVFCEEE